MGAMASLITSLTIVYSTVYSGVNQRKHQSSASLASVRWPVNSPHKWPVTRKMFPFDDVLMNWSYWKWCCLICSIQEVEYACLMFSKPNRIVVHSPPDQKSLVIPLFTKSSPVLLTFTCVTYRQFIMVVSHKGHGVSSHWQLHCFVSGLGADKKENIKALNYWPFVRRIQSSFPQNASNSEMFPCYVTSCLVEFSTRLPNPATSFLI